jgi:5-methylthioadenosine/S-adenosylhomocysteine deaminase
VTARTALVGGEILQRLNGRWVAAPATVVWADGRVVEVAPPGRSVQDATEVSAAGRLVVPGFLNAHYHSTDQLFRGQLDRGPLEAWVEPWGALGDLADEDVLAAAGWAALELLRSGTTRVIDHFAPARSANLVRKVLREYDSVGISATLAPLIGNRLYADVPPLGQGAEPTPDEVDTLLGEVADLVRGVSGRGHSLLLGPSAPQRCSDALLRGLDRLAREHDLGLHMHCAESPLHARTAGALWGTSAVQHLADLDLLGPRLSLAHCVWLTPDEIRLLADSGTTVVHNPTSNAALGSGIAPVRQLLDAGVAVALGTDGVEASGPTDIFRTLRDTHDLSRLRDADPATWLSTHEVLDLLWCGGRAVFGDRVGQVAEGADADLVLLDLGHPAFRPRVDVADQLVLHADPTAITDVYIGGRHVLRERATRGAEVDTALNRLEDAWQSVARLTEHRPPESYRQRVHAAYARRSNE